MTREQKHVKSCPTWCLIRSIDDMQGLAACRMQCKRQFGKVEGVENFGCLTGQMESYFTNLGVTEIRGFTLLNHHLR